MTDVGYKILHFHHMKHRLEWNVPSFVEYIINMFTHKLHATKRNIYYPFCICAFSVTPAPYVSLCWAVARRMALGLPRMHLWDMYIKSTQRKWKVWSLYIQVEIQGLMKNIGSCIFDFYKHLKSFLAVTIIWHSLIVFQRHHG